MPGVSEGMQAMSAAAVVDALTGDVSDPDALLLDAGGVDGAELTSSAEFSFLLDSLCLILLTGSRTGE